MENNNSTPYPLLNTFISICGTVIAWISIKEAQIYFGIGASIVAIVAGIFSARYYWYAAQEKKKSLHKFKRR